ncbi:MAG: zinc-binding dehydrogenase [Chloroflexi bacterium]|uniref:Zinc-binding dehydrogenase n=1 Tax=Candidatus Chlorohelix allophototropha TaxID=3003348 RepID=A0A8T7M6A3_9CHLR|nr:zinc-binding dehydrogenase [Chloroflexota bacterium]WJW69563.1 zinc-dependent alcohol dehydrogenase family protein [Chloroflexota bacterium L227-S17]
MKTRAAVLYDTSKPRPYEESLPLVIEEIEIDPPGAGEVLVEMAGAGLCHSDLSVINGSIMRPNLRKYGGETIREPLPVVMGHEASGIVREVGAGVTDFKPDDHVVFSFVPMCGRCEFCIAGKPALCKVGGKSNLSGTLINGSVRFRHTTNGKPVLHYLGVAGFSQYTVAAQESLVKITNEIELDKAALFGCAIVTGVGAVINTAKLVPGSSAAIFGLGGVGLSAVMGAKLAGANPIIAIDPVISKFELARQLGADYTLSPEDSDPIKAIRELTGGGADYAFAAVGSAKVLAQAYDSTKRGGTTISIGMPHSEQQLIIPAYTLTYQEKILQGSFMGSAIPSRDIPRLIDLYMKGKLPVDLLLSEHIILDNINAGFDKLAQGTTVRQMVFF